MFLPSRQSNSTATSTTGIVLGGLQESADGLTLLNLSVGFSLLGRQGKIWWVRKFGIGGLLGRAPTRPGDMTFWEKQELQNGPVKGETN